MNKNLFVGSKMPIRRNLYGGIIFIIDFYSRMYLTLAMLIQEWKAPQLWG